MARLSDDECADALGTLSGWSFEIERSAISKSFRFTDFSAAFAFMTRVALAAEKADHHPNWSNVWNRVDIALTTHSENGVTVKDFALAREIETIWAGSQAG